MIVKRSLFPLRTIQLSVNDSIFKIRPGEIIHIDILKNDIYDVVVYMDWIEKREKLKLCENSKLVIKHRIPDVYNLTALSIMVLLFSLYITGIIPVIFFSIFSMTFIALMFFITIFQKEKYFIIKVE